MRLGQVQPDVNIKSFDAYIQISRSLTAVDQMRGYPMGAYAVLPVFRICARETPASSRQ